MKSAYSIMGDVALNQKSLTIVENIYIAQISFPVPSMENQSMVVDSSVETVEQPALNPPWQSERGQIEDLQ